eukprot:5774248-Prymnesium_polylepis.2
MTARVSPYMVHARSRCAVQCPVRREPEFQIRSEASDLSFAFRDRDSSFDLTSVSLSPGSP